jgi:hypothetical protein
MPASGEAKFAPEGVASRPIWPAGNPANAAGRERVGDRLVAPMMGAAVAGVCATPHIAAAGGAGRGEGIGALAHHGIRAML